MVLSDILRKQKLACLSSGEWGKNKKSSRPAVLANLSQWSHVSLRVTRMYFRARGMALLSSSQHELCDVGDDAGRIGNDSGTVS